MSEQIHHINSSAELQQLFSSSTYVAVDFFADWCPPCKAISPVFESLAAKNSNANKLAFAKVNIDHVQDVARTYRVNSVPTFIFFKNGKQVAVHGKPIIQGADVRSLGAAVDKLSGLAQKQ